MYMYINVIFSLIFQALFLRELCNFAQSLEMESGTKFYHRLCAFELMPALEHMLVSGCGTWVWSHYIFFCSCVK